jgi:hypothetical protein
MTFAENSSENVTVNVLEMIDADFTAVFKQKKRLLMLEEL